MHGAGSVKFLLEMILNEALQFSVQFPVFENYCFQVTTKNALKLTNFRIISSTIFTRGINESF